MIDQDESDETPSRTPQEINRPVADLDLAIVVDGSLRRREPLGVGEAVLEADLSPVESGPTAPSHGGTGSRGEGDGGRSGPGNELMVALDQGADHLARGVVGVGDEQQGAVEDRPEVGKEGDELVEQGAAIGVAQDHALVDASDERHGADRVSQATDEQRDGLEGAAHDELGLGVVAGLGVQGLDRRHLAALLGDLEPVGDADDVGADAKRREQAPSETDPEAGEGIEAQATGVEVMAQAVVAGRVEPGGAHEAGHPGAI